MDGLEAVEVDWSYYRQIQLNGMLMLNHLLILHVYTSETRLVDYFHDPNEFYPVF
jgi:hypothetical protein